MRSGDHPRADRGVYYFEADRPAGLHERMTLPDAIDAALQVNTVM